MITDDQQSSYIVIYSNNKNQPLKLSFIHFTPDFQDLPL